MSPHFFKLPRGICSVPCQLVYVRRLNSLRASYRPARLVQSALKRGASTFGNFYSSGSLN